MNRNKMVLKSVVSVIFFCTWISSVSGTENLQTVLSVEEIKQLIPQIEAAEKRIDNIKIDAEAWMEESNSPNGPWVRTTTYVAATSWFDGNPKGKGRVDVHKEVMNAYWVDKNRYVQTEKSYKASFDGNIGRVVYESESVDAEKPRFINRGKIIAQVPDIFEGKTIGVVTGLRFTTKYFFVDKEKDKESFSKYFKIALSPEAIANNSFEIVREEYNGVQSIKLGLKHKLLRINYWFDPSRGFAFLGYENVRKNEKGEEFVDERFKVNKLEEISDGIWWPMGGTIESDRRDRRKPNTFTRTVFRTLDVVVDNSKFDNSVFSVSFPTGYTVVDEVNNRTYKVVEDPNRQN